MQDLDFNNKKTSKANSICKEDLCSPTSRIYGHCAIDVVLQ